MPAPKYQQIADDLRLKIEKGELQPGDRLPPEPELCVTYAASRNTVRLAIAALLNLGLVVPRQGLGTFVAEEIVPYTVLLSAERGWNGEAGQGGAYVQSVKLAGRNPETHRFVVEVREATDDVAEHLDLTPGDPVVLRHAERLIDGQPWSIISSFYPMDIARGTPLELAGSIRQGVIRLLAELGHQQAGYRDEITARMPAPDELNFFRLPGGIPLIVVDRTAYDSARPIRLTRHVYPADRNRLAYDQGELPEGYQALPKPPARARDGVIPADQASLPAGPEPAAGGSPEPAAGGGPATNRWAARRRRSGSARSSGRTERRAAPGSRAGPAPAP
ncbi:MAG TPA: GntR family transcriptional regulator [Streptosporangiaceae bacterium]|jgi:GntR family transcriptional regulator